MPKNLLLLEIIMISGSTVMEIRYALTLDESFDTIPFSKYACSGNTIYM